MPFIRVPNAIIKYSCSINHIILPVYLYSAIHCNPNNNNIVDTNIAHISETFAPNEDVRRKIHLKVESVIRLLMSDVEDFNPYNTTCNTYSSIPNNIPNADFYKEIVKGFSACFDGSINENLDKTTRIQYQFLDRNVKMECGFTVMDYDEYFYILNSVTKINEDKGKTTKSNKWNIIDLINFYMYLKMRITYFSNVSNSNNSNSSASNSNNSNSSNSLTAPKFTVTMHDSISKLAFAMKVGNKTIAKYTNELTKLGLITTKIGNFYYGKSTEYFLSDNWKSMEFGESM